MSAIGTEHEHASIDLDGTPYEVVHLTGRESLSELFHFTVTFATTGGGPNPKSFIAKPAVITLRDGFGRERTITGVVAEASTIAGDHSQTWNVNDNAVIGKVVVRPTVYPISLGRDNRVFQDMTVVDIVKKVMGKSGAPSRWEVNDGYPTHVYSAQYREDDWTYVSRMLEEEGIYYWFDHDAGSTIVFSDTSTGAQELTGGADLNFLFEAGMNQLDETIMELGEEVAATPTMFTVGSFDENKPLEKIEASVGSGFLEIYDAPGGGPEPPGECARQAKFMKEAADAAAAGIFGQSTTIRAIPGRIMAVNDHPVARFNRRFLVTAVSYEVKQSRDEDDTNDRKYLCWLHAIPDTTPYRAPRDTPIGKQAGLQSAVIAGPPSEEVFPDEKGRVRTQLHWDREGDRGPMAGKWMRVAQRGVASSMLLPRIGWNVMTFNTEGQIDAPSVLNRVHDAEHPPEYALPANKTRVVWKTATTPGGGSFNEIYFEDKKGNEEMFWNASRDKNVIVLHCKNEGVKRDATRKVGNDHKLTVGDAFSQQVGHDQTVSIGGNEEIEVKGGMSKKVDGNEVMTIVGNRKIKTVEQCGLDVKGNRTMQVGQTLTCETQGKITSQSGGNFDMTVGGSLVRKSDQSIVEDVGKISTQEITGSKTESCKMNRMLDIKGVFNETITGAVTLHSDEHFVCGAEKTANWQVTAAMDSTAPDIYIEASKSIELVVGGSTIYIDANKVEFKSPSFNLDNSELLEAKAGIITHN